MVEELYPVMAQNSESTSIGIRNGILDLLSVCRFFLLPKSQNRFGVKISSAGSFPMKVICTSSCQSGGDLLQFCHRLYSRGAMSVNHFDLRQRILIYSGEAPLPGFMRCGPVPSQPIDVNNA